MHMRVEFGFSLALLPVTALWCLRISRFDVPPTLVPGDSAYLTCLYDLGGEKLYSVKWFKDDHEFYRFFPSLSPPFMAFKAPGLQVDLSRSGRSTVYLRNVTLDTEGRYTCQVSADEPFFGCVQVHRDITVYVPPESGAPEIEGSFTEYGDNFTVRCSSAKSRPAANISWFINDAKAIPAGVSTTHEVTLHPDHLESSHSRLDIPVESLPEGVVKLACEASISNVVTSVSKELLVAREHNDQPPAPHLPHRDPQEVSSRQTRPQSWALLLLLWIAWLHSWAKRF